MIQPPGHVERQNLHDVHDFHSQQSETDHQSDMNDLQDGNFFKSFYRPIVD